MCSDVGYDEKRVNSIRRIDFAWAVEREDPSKKRKVEGSSAKEGAKTSQQQWQWQGLVENLQLAHQELSVIIDLINTVKLLNFFCVFLNFKYCCAHVDLCVCKCNSPSCNVCFECHA